ncbi:hypothetical protein SELMODRAFT_127549 [Selaginella moellendorffii]|uniref:Transmembrane protein 45B n=1 Tax=Selaginella moellendorffii TaxID=88036 RepID=D8SY65_SELML|nr:transmembrane protein 45B [Selaginella moellendorffii]EFJ10739.1 hypothetical protein SELMODRAFT_127549 [Selaginella moellendorffii]|eukprot:XP_002988320.1 transmembrane protein 45B [Selaginella moellendorffii]
MGGTLAAHALPGIFLIAIGFWHQLRAISTYIRSPRDYSARLWHPVAGLRGRIKHLELYILLLALPIAIVYELAASTDFQALLQIGAPNTRVVDFQRAAMLLGFLFLVVVLLVSDTTLWLPLPAEAAFLLSAVAFGIEWMVLSQHGQDLEGKCNAILSNLAAACSISAALLAWKPTAILADLVLTESILLQGSWLVQSGLTLFVKSFTPEGCHQLLDLPRGVGGSTKCDLEEARARAFSLVDLAFICHLLVAMVVSSLLYCGVARRRSSGGGYDHLPVVDIESSNGSSIPMKPITKQAQY